MKPLLTEAEMEDLRACLDAEPEPPDADWLAAPEPEPTHKEPDR